MVNLVKFRRPISVRYTSEHHGDGHELGLFKGNMIYRLIAPDWAVKEGVSPKVLEGEFSQNTIDKHNSQGYNIYFLPNYPKNYQGGTVDGTMIDTFEYVFVDCDIKEKIYSDKEAFLEKLADVNIPPTRIVDSGNGIHAYWRVSNLDPMSYLRFQRRLMRLYKTDESLATLYQLMRVPFTMNTKVKNNFVICETLAEFNNSYTCEELDKLLPPIAIEDEKSCIEHFDKTFGLNQDKYEVAEEMPPKFGKLLRDNSEVKDLWSAPTDDRSKNDFRLGHIMYGNGFSKEEAASVLVNSAKALQRAPVHRRAYATGIVDKIWTFEITPETATLSPTVRDILMKGDDTLKGTRFPCNRLIDDTVHGFRLGQVIGIVGGSGVGKTTLTLNTFLWFAEQNPDFQHFFVSLEQPAGEIASRIRTICQGNENLYDKIHIISNYAENGEYRHFSLDGIEEHLLKFEQDTGKKVGAVVIDHIGVLAKSDKHGESEGLIGICRRMKAVAVRVNMMLIMLSQAPREKAGVGDLELNKDAAFGTVFFESFLDYCICLWQPLKRVYQQGAPTIMAIKFAKIRHKKQGQDRIQEDICYQLYFDPQTELLRELTQEEEISARFYLGQAVTARKLDRKTDITSYQSRLLEDRPSTEQFKKGTQ